MSSTGEAQECAVMSLTAGELKNHTGEWGYAMPNTLDSKMAARTGVKRVVMLIAIAGLVGCATGPRKETYWVNPRIDPSMWQSRFTLDSTECEALANQLIPEPAPPPQPQNGTITLDTPNGPVYGSYQQQPSVPEGFQPTGFLAGYERGTRQIRRENYASACIANRGWQQRVRVVAQ